MANPDTALAKPEKCSAPELYDAVTDFCFGHADEAKRRLVEEHLTVCAACRREVAKLTSAVEALRFDQELMPPVAPVEVAAAFGISARLNEPFGGHIWMVLISCALYALLYVETLWTEIGLQIDHYADYALRGTPVIFVLIFSTTFAALRLCHRRVQRGGDYSLTLSFCLIAAAGLGAYGLSWVLLPNVRINGTSTPQETFFRNTTAFLGLATFCLLIPFHFVTTMQRELSEGKHSASFRFLLRQKDGMSPQKVIYLDLRLVLVLLTLLAFSVWWGNEIYFTSLPPSRNRNFFVTAVQLLWFSFHGLGAGWLIWYSRMINELKRECLIAQPFD